MGLKDRFKFGNDRSTEGDLDRPVNLYVHQRDKKGAVASVAPYRLIIDNGQQMFEVPPGSGKFYSANGQLIQESEDSAKREKQGGFDSGAPMSHPAGKPKEGMLGEVKDNQDQRPQAGDDHVSKERAQQELNAQGGKATQENFQQAPQTKGSFTSKPDDGQEKKK